MGEPTKMALGKDRHFIKPGTRDELAKIIHQKTVQKMESKAKRRIATAKTKAGESFRRSCDTLFNLAEEDVKNLPGAHIVELEKEIVRRNKKKRFQHLVCAAASALFGGGGIFSVIFGTLIIPPRINIPFPHPNPVEYLGNLEFAGGMLIFFGLHIAVVGIVGSVLFSQKVFENYVTACKSLKEKIKALYPSASEMEAEEKFSAELLDAIRKS